VLSTKDTYKCPGDTAQDCQRGGAYSATAAEQKLKSTTAEAAAKEDISKNATESYGKGYGSILKAAFIGRVSPHFHRIYGHARPGASQALNKKFGARFLHTHRNWFQTGEDYKSYVLDLEGATD